MRDSEELLIGTAMDLLETYGPLEDVEWAETLAEEGYGDFDEMLDLVENIEHPYLGFLVDGRNIALDAILEGCVFTHRLAQLEIDSGIVEASIDLVPVTALLFDNAVSGMRLVFGTNDPEPFVERGVNAADWSDAILLPTQDALKGRVAGDLIAFRINDAEPELVQDAVDVTDPIDEIGKTIVELVGDDSQDFESVLTEVIYEYPLAFTDPIAPISEILTAAGITLWGAFIAKDGFDFEGDRWQKRLSALMDEHRVTADEAATVLTFEDLVWDIARGVTPEEAVRYRIDQLGGLADEFIAAISFGSAVLHASQSDAVQSAASALLLGPRKLAPAAYWMLGLLALQRGELTVAEQSFERAGMWPPALFELARFASDRGDATRALSLLNRSDHADEPIYDIVQQFAAVDRPDLGRNDKCWCGSGRKYKVCHLGKTDFGLDRRAEWLYAKAVQFVDEPEFREQVIELALERAVFLDSESALLDALSDPFVIDVALSEGNLFTAFLERRGSLLPADELELAQQWLTCERSLYEVLAVEGTEASLRDMRTGDEVTLSEGLADFQPQVGALYCLRPLPAGETRRIFGGVEPVPLTHKELVVEMLDDKLDPGALIAFLSRRQAPSRAVTD